LLLPEDLLAESLPLTQGLCILLPSLQSELCLLLLSAYLISVLLPKMLLLLEPLNLLLVQPRNGGCGIASKLQLKLLLSCKLLLQLLLVALVHTRPMRMLTHGWFLDLDNLWGWL